MTRARHRRDLERVYALFPMLERAQPAAGEHALGRRAADAGDRPRADGRPKLLLLDEPSVGIAHRLKVQIFQAIRAIQRGGTAVLLVEQDARTTMAVAKRIYVLEHGRFVREGSTQEIAADDDIRRVYLGL